MTAAAQQPACSTAHCKFSVDTRSALLAAALVHQVYVCGRAYGQVRACTSASSRSSYNMSAWKLVVNFAIPPALVLTILLILPIPNVVKKRLLGLTRSVLFFNVLGNVKLVHFMIALTGAAFAASCSETYHLTQAAAHDDAVSPNQRIHQLAKRWRSERNFWIAALSFLLWGFLYRFYQLMLNHMALSDKTRQLEARLARVLEGGVTPPKTELPSAPAAPPAGAREALPAGAGVTQRAAAVRAKAM